MTVLLGSRVEVVLIFKDDPYKKLIGLNLKHTIYKKNVVCDKHIIF